MQININQREAYMLLNALRGYIMEVREENAELIELESSRQHRGCCIDGGYGESAARLRGLLGEQEDFLVELRDKLKKHQMKFPCEEHKPMSEKKQDWYDPRCFG